MALDHTIRAFDDDMARLDGLIAQMGGLAESLLRDAVDALQRSDTELAAGVIARDRDLDLLEAEAEKLSIRLIALRAPVADDLRQVVAAFRISGMLERIGDHAKNIARSTLKIDGARFAPLDQVPEMAEAAAGMVRHALDAYAARDANLAQDVVTHDDAVDAMYRDLIGSVVEQLSHGGVAVVPATETLLVARHVERIGDNATNIAEVVYYAVTGVVLPDRHSEGQ